MGTPIYIHHSYHQLPMICEPMNDGTGRLMCVPVEQPTPLWLKIGIGALLLWFVCYVGWQFFDHWRWERKVMKGGK